MITEMQADYTDEKKTGRNGEKGDFEITKLGRWEKKKEIANRKFQLNSQHINNTEKIDKMRREVYEITLSLGGAITAEHGIGLSKIQYLEMALDKTQIEIMRSIKKIFDPKNILNPGKIFTSQ